MSILLLIHYLQESAETPFLHITLQNVKKKLFKPGTDMSQYKMVNDYLNFNSTVIVIMILIESLKLPKL